MKTSLSITGIAMFGIMFGVMLGMISLKKELFDSIFEALLVIVGSLILITLITLLILILKKDETPELLRSKPQ